MRISVNKKDPGYDVEATIKYQPYLDGKKVDHCITADEEKDICICYKTDAEGKIVLNSFRDDTIRRVLRGHVVIKKVK
jgi:hypothetical protein